MNFIELSESEFEDFAKKSPYRSFTQTPEIAHLREKDGWTAYYLGVKKAGILKAATLLVKKPTFLGKSTFLAPGGPLLNFEDRPLTEFFLKNLKAFAKSHNGYILHIDPCYELIERTRSGEKKAGGFDRTSTLKTLKALNFQPTPHSGQPKYDFVLELKNRTPDEIFADLKRNTRNHIRKAEKMGVKIRELNREELKIFKQITESTSRRRNFEDRPLSYYEQMYDLFHQKGEVKFIVAEVDAGSVALETVSRNPYEDFEASEPHDDGRERAGSRELQTSIPLSAAMFILYGSEIIYLFSGSDEKYMKDYNAQYLIQWHMIKYAAEHGYKTYNFYGINGLPDPNSKDYGIYDFKKGFTSEETGRVVELLGAFEASVNRPFSLLHALLLKLKDFFKK